MSKEQRARLTEEVINMECEKARSDTQKWNMQARRERPRWEVVQRSALGDTRAEDTTIRYLRRPNKGEEGQVDWFKTIQELSKLGEKLGYTGDHYKATLDRWVYFLHPI